MALIIERKRVFQDGAGKQVGTSVKPGMSDCLIT